MTTVFGGMSLILLSAATMASAAPATGEHVIVAAPQARVMRGNEVLATVHNGQRLEVLKREGPWVGTIVHVGDKNVGGWIYQGDLAGGNSGVALAAPGRRFSYEGDAAPAVMQPQRNYGSSNFGGNTPKYMLPKTDRNRFR